MTFPLPDDLVTGNPIDADEDWNPLARAVNTHQTRLDQLDETQEQAGTASVNVAVATVGQIAVTFPTPYPTVPVLTYSLTETTALGLVHKISAISAAGFTVRVNERTAAPFTATLTIGWIARLP